jgi:hypothetical protein
MYNSQTERVLSEIVRILAKFIKARAVEKEKQPLLGNNLYTRSRGKVHVRCDVRQQ